MVDNAAGDEKYAYALSAEVQKALQERHGGDVVEFFVDELRAPDESKILEFMRTNFSPEVQAQIIERAKNT